MSEPENFLERWSRLKREGAKEATPSAAPEEGGADRAHVAQPKGVQSLPPRDHRAPLDNSAAPEFDVSTLPSLESITAETDIRVFLQQGVPAELSRAALRRAWAADPIIRDFIGIAENQYDFATGSDLPGFGPLDASADELKRMVARVFGEGAKPPAENTGGEPAEPETTAKPVLTDPGDSAEPLASSQVVSTANQEKVEDAPTSADDLPDSMKGKDDLAVQQTAASDKHSPRPTRRAHGRALPE